MRIITPEEKAELLARIEAYLVEHKETAANFGRRVGNDLSFIHKLRAGNLELGVRRYEKAQMVLSEPPPPRPQPRRPSQDEVADGFADDLSEREIARKLGTTVNMVRSVWAEITRSMLA